MTERFDLPYIKCDPCQDRDHDACEGADEAKPFCGCRCPDLMTVRDEETP